MMLRINGAVRSVHSLAIKWSWRKINILIVAYLTVTVYLESCRNTNYCSGVFTFLEAAILILWERGGMFCLAGSGVFKYELYFANG